MKKKKGENKNNARRRTQQSKAYQLSGRGYTAAQNPNITFLDPHQFMVLRYYETILSGSILTVAGFNQVMRINSIFDPNAAVGGGQPHGYDQVSGSYNRYRCLRADWKIHFTASSNSYLCVVTPVNGAINAPVADSATFSAAAMLPFSKPDHYDLGARGPTISGSMQLNCINGVPRVEFLADDRFEAQFAANPSEVMSLNIGVYNPSGSTINVLIMVELWYHVDLHDPIISPPSYHRFVDNIRSHEKAKETVIKEREALLLLT